MNKYEIERSEIELIENRMHLLSSRDRTLLTLHFAGAPANQLAMMIGRSTRSVQRKIRRLKMILTSKQIEKLLALMNTVNKIRSDVILHHFIRRQSMRKTAELCDISLHQTRVAIIAIKEHLKIT